MWTTSKVSCCSYSEPIAGLRCTLCIVRSRGFRRTKSTQRAHWLIYVSHCLHVRAGGQTNPEHLRQIYQAHLMLQLRVQDAGEYQQPEAIMTAARAVRHMHLITKTQHLACNFQ